MPSEEADASGAGAALDDLPPSAKLVALILRREGPLTQSAISEESRLTRSTTVHAVDALKEHDLLEAEFADGDDDRYAYRLSDAVAEALDEE